MASGFEAEYQKLNKAQKQAVDYIDGPLLVVAGPGTGKTQLLSLRVANILDKTDTDPGGILCLTFTNFAATNMRDRLNHLIGAGAHAVNVKTFHSFASEIMNLYPDYFWNGARLSIVPDAVQLDIIQNILNELPLDNPLAIKFAGNFTATGDVQRALRLSKEAGLTPEKLIAILSINEAYISEIEPLLVDVLSQNLSYKNLAKLSEAISKLPEQDIDASIAPLTSLSTIIKTSLQNAIDSDEGTNKATNTSKWKRLWLQSVKGEKGMFDERRRLKWWQSFALVYQMYRDRLHSRGYYDYSDMIIEVISQLEQQPELLASVQERYLYVLIDEFQDANAAQLRLAHLVADHYSAEGRPNLMAVGDDDQSIFAFNGAELNNMLTLKRNYPDLKTIVLTDNYRSTQAVLDNAQKIIEQSEDRLTIREPELTKNLQAVTKQHIGQLGHMSYPSREHQMLGLAQTIEKRWKDDPELSLAVLARGHDSLRTLSSYLLRFNLPVRYEQQNNILDQPLVQQINLIAELVIAIHGGNVSIVNHHVAELIKYPAWQIGPDELWQMALNNYDSKENWLDSLKLSSNKSLNNLADWLMWLASESTIQPLQVMIEYILGLRAGNTLTSPLRDYYLGLKPITSNYLDSLSGLRVLQSLVREFTLTQTTEPKLTDFVMFMAATRAQSRPITDESWFASGEKAIQLLTVHKAKGLEFDTVYLIDAVESEWQPRFIGRKPPANLPLQPYGEHFDDYARLAYVAATRAKSTFIVSSYEYDEKGQSILASPLFINLDVQKSKATIAGDNLNILESALRWPSLDTDNQRALLREKVRQYNLNPTGLGQFLDLNAGGPQNFLERQLLRLPQILTPDMAYGTSIHNALQLAQKLVNLGRFDLAAVLEQYETTLKAQPITENSLKRYTVHGQQVLTALFKEHGFSLNKGGQAEVWLNDLKLGGVPVSGALDHVYEDKGSLIITDYKTGRPISSFETKAQGSSLKAWRHKQQLLFYILMVKASGRYKATENISAQVAYLEAEDSQQMYLTLRPEPAELERMEALIKAVWQQIINLSFPDTSSYEASVGGIRQFEDELIKGKFS